MNDKNLFCIAALKIGEKCDPNIKKNLNTGFYLFNDRCCLENDNIVLNPNYDIRNNIYGDNIFLHAIVGMNGSGKSSLLEIIYRMVNNLSWYVDNCLKKKSKLLLICQLDAELYYTINDVLYTLVCQEESVKLFEKKKDVEKRDVSACFSNIREITEKFFYSIVTNYSMQSLISSDYKGEVCKEIPGSGYIQNDPWIHRIFHKNDGYATAVVLNPYRSKDGWIDVGEEERLTISRLSSLLFYFEKKRMKLVNEYGLKEVSFKHNFHYVEKKLEPTLLNIAKKESTRKNSKKNNLSQKFYEALYKAHSRLDSKFFKTHPDSFICFIAQKFGYDKNVEYDEILIDAFIYLAYKVLSIASRYPLYSEYAELGGFVERLDEDVDQERMKLLNLLVKKIKDGDKSHITVKVHQVINFISNYNKIKKLISKPNGFSVKDYLKCLNFDATSVSLMELKRHLPPPFFSPSIFLYKTSQNSQKKIGNIPFEKLSSGERQLFCTLSTFVYHMENLLSVKSTKIPKYNKINLILEEIEICFHPDYQRCFVDNLVSMMERLGYNKKFVINIILVTHSPFILSDVPKQNILYLRDGKDASSEIEVNPFAANVCDVLHQSFFLKKGFIGAFAQRKIKELIRTLERGTETLDKGWIKSHICNLIGETVIRDYMLRKFGKEE